MSSCENPQMHWERKGRWHQAWIQIKKKCSWKSSGKKNSDCTIGKFGVPFQSCNGQSFWSQMENTTCCYRSAAFLCTQAVYDHCLAGRLKLICSTTVPHRILALQCFIWSQLLRCSVSMYFSGSITKTTAVISYAFMESNQNKCFGHCFIKKKKKHQDHQAI